MRSVIRHRRQGSALSAWFLIASTVFGVLLMHSVTPPTSIAGSMPAPVLVSESMSGSHAAMASTTAVDSAVPVASAKHHCPSSARHMMHPCAGTTVSWPALHVPVISAGMGQLQTSADRIATRTDFAFERAPPWTLWELDRSVTLRV